MIPMLAGIMTIQIILKIGGIFRADFGLFYQVPRNIGALYRTTDVIETYIFRAMRISGDMGTSSATGLLQSIVGFVLVVFTNWVVGRFDRDKQLF
jgi:putative aldouronate transport system permease protein